MAQKRGGISGSILLAGVVRAGVFRLSLTGRLARRMAAALQGRPLTAAVGPGRDAP